MVAPPRLLCPLAVALLVSCAPPKGAFPASTVCSRFAYPGANSTSLASALQAATPGSCVVAAAGTYEGAFSVPAGVALAAEVNSAVVFKNPTNGAPAVKLAKGATLAGVQVADAREVGIWVDVGANIVSTSVKACRFGVVFWCEEDCRDALPGSGMQEVTLEDNTVGLMVHGADMVARGGGVRNSRSTDVASGYGVVACHGASVAMEDAFVEHNDELGLLIDGARGTSARLSQVAVQNNRGRGLWAQDLAGTVAVPRLQLSSCTVEGNALAGLGARSSRGIVVQGGRVQGTTLGKAQGPAGTLVSVGDGVGLFENTGDVLLDGVLLGGNGRSQLLVDTGAANVVANAAVVNQGTGQFGVVVQRTTAPVQAPSITVPSPGNELPVSAPSLPVPVP